MKAIVGTILAAMVVMLNAFFDLRSVSWPSHITFIIGIGLLVWWSLEPKDEFESLKRIRWAGLPIAVLAVSYPFLLDLSVIIKIGAAFVSALAAVAFFASMQTGPIGTKDVPTVGGGGGCGGCAGAGCGGCGG